MKQEEILELENKIEKKFEIIDKKGYLKEWNKRFYGPDDIRKIGNQIITEDSRNLKPIYSRSSKNGIYVYDKGVFTFKKGINKIEPLNDQKIDNWIFFEKVKNIIENKFGLSLFEIPIPKIDLYPIPIDYIIGSKDALAHTLNDKSLLVGNNKKFFEDFDNYFLMGVWGYGTNSHYFHYYRSDH